jgi:hypothetical protein
MAEGEKPKSNLSIQTLLISACSAVAAATIVPRVWEAGTVVATAMTPVVVALVSEALRKPVERVSVVAPRVARRTGTGAAVRRFDPDAASSRQHAEVGARGRGPERFEPLPPHRRGDPPRVSDDDPFGLRAAQRPAGRLSGRRVRIAVITGLLAFALAAAVVTASELTIFGGSVSGKRGSTTLFSGASSSSTKSRSKDSATPTPSATATPQSESTATPTATATPSQTATPSATPTQTAAPSATATP